MRISSLGLKAKFALHSLLALALVGWSVSEIVADYLPLNIIKDKMNIVELIVSNAAASKLLLLEDTAVSDPAINDRGLLFLVSHLNTSAASNYFIWDDSGKLIYQNPQGQQILGRRFRALHKNSYHLPTTFEIVDSKDFLANKYLKIMAVYQDPLTHKNFIIDIFFSLNSITAHHYEQVKSIVLVFCVALLVLYILHTRVLISVTKRLGYKKKKLKAQDHEIISSLDTSINTLVRAIDARDSYTAEHSIRVMNYVKLIGEKMSLSGNEIKQLMIAAQLHDIGKIGMPDSVLLKKGQLSNDEYDIIKTHPDIGVAILHHHPKFDEIIPAVHYHHERYDGKGYPSGLSGNEIPLLSRIIAVADAYDAMTSKRPYSLPLTAAEALQELSKCSGTQFDPDITTIFIKILAMENKIDYEPLLTELYFLN